MSTLLDDVSNKLSSLPFSIDKHEFLWYPEIELQEHEQYDTTTNDY